MDQHKKFWDLDKALSLKPKQLFLKPLEEIKSIQNSFNPLYARFLIMMLCVGHNIPIWEPQEATVVPIFATQPLKKSEHDFKINYETLKLSIVLCPVN